MRLLACFSEVQHEQDKMAPSCTIPSYRLTIPLSLLLVTTHIWLVQITRNRLICTYEAEYDS